MKTNKKETKEQIGTTVSVKVRESHRDSIVRQDMVVDKVIVSIIDRLNNFASQHNVIDMTQAAHIRDILIKVKTIAGMASHRAIQHLEELRPYIIKVGINCFDDALQSLINYMYTINPEQKLDPIQVDVITKIILDEPVLNQFDLNKLQELKQFDSDIEQIAFNTGMDYKNKAIDEAICMPSALLERIKDAIDNPLELSTDEVESRFLEVDF